MNTPDDLARVRAAFAEAGIDPQAIFLNAYSVIRHKPSCVSDYTAWKAMTISGLGVRCWPCRREQGSAPPDQIPEPCGHPIDPFCPEDAEMAG